MSKSPYKFHEQDLVAYLEGAASPEVVSAIERDPAAMAEVKALRSVDTVLRTTLYRIHCPDMDELLHYQVSLLPEVRSEQIRQHVSTCPHCQHELAALATVSTELSARSPALVPPSLRTRIEQFGQDILAALRPFPSNLAPAVRGTATHEAKRELLYEAGEYRIILMVAPPLAAESVRHIEGQITAQQNPATAPLGVRVSLLAQSETVRTDHVDEFGYFALDNVESGEYTIRIETAPDNIIIEGLAIA